MIRKAGIFFLMMVSSLVAHAQGFTWIDISYKVVLNPANGQRPIGVANADIQQNVADMNALMEPTLRGIRFRISEIVDVGGVGDSFSQSWYNTNITSSNKGNMESDAKANSAYAWRNNDVNIYINQGEGSAICSFPGGGSIIVVGGHSDYFPARHIHEIGHYYDLCHTQGCPCGSCDAGETGTCHTTPGNDDIDDTLPDLACWTRDDVAQNAYGSNYASLTNSQKNRVDNVFDNIMSYHSNRVRLTDDQLDHWTDLSNGSRSGPADRRNVFVSKSGNFLFQFGTSTLPYLTVGNATGAAPNSSVLIMKPGAYNETITINKPLSIRATRAGVVTIGSNSISITEDEQSTIMALNEEGYDDLYELGKQYKNGIEAYQKYNGYTHEEEEAQSGEIDIIPLNIFPNPNNGIFSVKVNPELIEGRDNVMISIYNLKGEQVLRQELSKNYLDVDLTTQSKGVYYIKLSGVSDETLLKKLVYQ